MREHDLSTSGQPTMKQKLGEALIMVIAVAVVGRVAWELLAPTLPLLITITALVIVGRWLVGSRGGYR